MAVGSSSGAGRKTTSAIASARMPPTPSITVGPNCGSRTTPAISSRLPDDHRRDEHVDVAVVGGRRGQQLGRGRLDGRPIAEAQPDQPTLGLVGDGVAVELRHDRVADVVRGVDRSGRRVDESLGSDRYAVAREQGLRGRVRTGSWSQPSGVTVLSSERRTRAMRHRQRLPAAFVCPKPTSIVGFGHTDPEGRRRAPGRPPRVVSVLVRTRRT